MENIRQNVRWGIHPKTGLVLERIGGAYALKNTEGATKIPLAAGRHIVAAVKQASVFSKKSDEYKAGRNKKTARAVDHQRARNDKYDCYSFVLRSLGVQVPLNKLVGEGYVCYQVLTAVPAHNVQTFDTVQDIIAATETLKNVDGQNLFVVRLFDAERGFQHAMLLAKVGNAFYFIHKAGTKGPMLLGDQDEFQHDYFVAHNAPYGKNFDVLPYEEVRKAAENIYAATINV